MVLINAGNQFEVMGANRAWSAIPEGIVDILRGESPPSSIGVTRFFIIFDTLVAIILAVQVWSLVRVIRHARARPGLDAATARDLMPLIWEIGVATVLLLAYPAATGGLGWRATFTFVPDLTVVIAVISGLWLATGAVRISRVLLARRAVA